MAKKNGNGVKVKKVYTSTYKGLPLIDANLGEHLEIEVTKQDVNRSRKNDPSGCAAAVAYKRIYQTDVEVHLSRTYVKSKDGKAWIRFKTPASISREIVSFDRSAHFEPGTYALCAPSKAEQLGQFKGKSTAKTGAKKSPPRHMTVNVRENAKPGNHR
jgi:hypothetical protein